VKQAVIIIILILFSLSAAGQTKEPDVDMSAIKVSDHVWYVMGKPGTAVENEGFISNASFIITNEGVVVFDSLGSPALSRLMLKEIRKLTDKPIKFVIVSHYHADHIYGLQVFKEEGAEIVAPSGAIDYLGSDAADSRLKERRKSLAPWVNDDTRLVPPDRYIKKSEKFKLGGVDFTITSLGSAHSEGDLTLFIEPDQVLLSGDVIFDGRIPWLGDSDTKNWLKTLKNILASRPAAIIPGHGKQSSDPEALIKLTLNYLEFVSRRGQLADLR